MIKPSTPVINIFSKLRYIRNPFSCQGSFEGVSHLQAQANALRITKTNICFTYLYDSRSLHKTQTCKKIIVSLLYWNLHQSHLFLFFNRV